MGMHGRKLAETKYSPEQNYRQLMEIFSSFVPSRTADASPLILS